jgi:hypothetical protein
MPTNIQPEGKNLYSSSQTADALSGLIGFTRNTLKFIEIVKTLFQQKGYVSAGLKANIKLKNVKIAFGN